MDSTSRLEVETIKEWRSWLENHYQTETEVWLVFDKKDAEKYQLDYTETVEEALCFGWIDGIKKKDGDRLLQRFTPRRTNSHWTELNKERVRRLMALGKMREQGIKVTPNLTVPFEIDHAIITELKKDPDTYQFFRTLPELYIRVRISYIQACKQDSPEYEKRLTKFLAYTAQRRLFGRYDDGGKLTGDYQGDDR
ncbi:YdeI/OmpD-associated family protein [Exiguobacterium artemiae]|uniref:YdeI/OmpD-associated family protein n=1 Tax=Exiguobacterium artemiae TaxID=340145 RepID=UPI0029640678|nr:YdeI/OmpD-associated family protein [Exiguobacterium sibiricum]MDW2886520.1 YdeI/OmpD-associated family protein [Exiguobacterium sibiricum]